MEFNSKKKWYNNNWIRGLALIVIAQVIIPGLISLFSNKGYVDTLKALWSYLVSTYPTPKILLYILLLFFLVTIISILYRKSPLYKLYNQDVFYGVIWKWS